MGSWDVDHGEWQTGVESAGPRSGKDRVDGIDGWVYVGVAVFCLFGSFHAFVVFLLFHARVSVNLFY